MLIMLLEKSPPSLKGELSRWLIEPKSGVFLGNPSARVRDELWEMAMSRIRRGSVTQIWSSPCPQGYRCRSFGPASRQFIDLEGIALPLRLEAKRYKQPRTARKSDTESESTGTPHDT